MLYAAVAFAAASGKIQAISVLRFVDELRRTGTSTLIPIGKVLSDTSIFHFQSSPGATMSALDQFAETHKPSEIIDYYLEMFCALLLSIFKSGSAGAAFARLAIARILARENTIIKPEHVNLSVISGTKLASDDFEMGSADDLARFDETLDDTAVPESESGPDDDETAEQEDPFSLDAFDIEDGREEEVVDQDDADAIMHLGNDMGW